jgi:hypothetical protein
MKELVVNELNVLKACERFLARAVAPDFFQNPRILVSRALKILAEESITRLQLDHIVKIPVIWSTFLLAEMARSLTCTSYPNEDIICCICEAKHLGTIGAVIIETETIGALHVLVKNKHA